MIISKRAIWISITSLSSIVFSALFAAAIITTKPERARAYYVILGIAILCNIRIIQKMWKSPISSTDFRIQYLLSMQRLTQEQIEALRTQARFMSLFWLCGVAWASEILGVICLYPGASSVPPAYSGLVFYTSTGTILTCVLLCPLPALLILRRKIATAIVVGKDELDE